MFKSVVIITARTTAAPKKPLATCYKISAS